jgi:hypothetical protein
MRVFILLAALAVSANATPLTCNIGHTTAADTTCRTATMGTNPYHAQACTTEGHTCLTGNYEGAWEAAYGCYPDAVVAGTKTWWTNACIADPECAKYNPSGPARGFTECKTNNCNPCGKAGGMSVGVILAIVLPSVTIVLLVLAHLHKKKQAEAAVGPNP